MADEVKLRLNGTFDIPCMPTKVSHGRAAPALERAWHWYSSKYNAVAGPADLLPPPSNSENAF